MVESVGKRLWFGPLDPLVAGFRGAEFFHLAEKDFFLGRELRSIAPLRRPDRNHVEMDPEKVGGIHLADSCGDRGAPVSSLNGKPLEAERLRHQLEKNIGDRLDVHRAGASMVRETVTRQRRRNHGERIGGIAAVSTRIRQHRNDVHEFVDRTGPSVDEQQRFGIRSSAFFVNEMNLEAADLGTEMTEAVQMRLMLAPVVAGAPVLNQFAQVGQIRAVFPSGVGHSSGKRVRSRRAFRSASTWSGTAIRNGSGFLWAISSTYPREDLNARNVDCRRCRANFRPHGTENAMVKNGTGGGSPVYTVCFPVPRLFTWVPDACQPSIQGRARAQKPATDAAAL